MKNENTKKIDKSIEFLQRYFKLSINTFNASSAIWRAEQLRNEISELSVKLADVKRDPPYWGFEFTSYYLVGLITCLEWHARSRFCDLLTYDPKNIKSDDLKQVIGANILEQLLHENLTIAQLISASTLVSDAEKYAYIFDRIFSYLGLTDKAANLIKKGDDTANNNFLILAQMFEARHSLVHEINETQVGHWNLRDYTSLENAQNYAKLVIEIMNLIEEKISLHAKPDFPNLIFKGKDDGSRWTRLTSLITQIEDEILLGITHGTDAHIDQDLLKSSILKSREHIQEEINTLMTAYYAGHRYFSISEPLVEQLLTARLSYVRRLRDELITTDIMGMFISSVENGQEQKIETGPATQEN
jgi:hypothetical protein